MNSKRVLGRLLILVFAWAPTALLVGHTASARANAAADYVNVSDFGAKGDGLADDTDAFRAAAKACRTLVVPKPRAYYRVSRRVDLCGSIVGIGSPEIRMALADGSAATVVLRIAGYEGPGMLVSGLTVNGNWDEQATSGEHGHGIAILGSKNVTVTNCRVERTYGDSVYVGALDGRMSENVLVVGNVLQRPRRCNVALVAVRGAKIVGCHLEKANDYVSSIDIEPNNDNRTTVEGVEIIDNDVEAGIAPFVNLYSFPPSMGYTRLVSGVAIVGNRIRGRVGLHKAPRTGSFEHIRVADNQFELAGAGHGGFISMAQEGSGGASTRYVVVERNVQRGGTRAGQVGWTFNSIAQLTVRQNTVAGEGERAIRVVRCMDAVVRDNAGSPSGRQ